MVKDIIDNFASIAPATVFVKPEQCKNTEERTKIKDRSRQVDEARMELALVAVSDPSKFDEKQSADIYDDVKTNPEAYLMALSCNGSDCYNARHAQPAHSEKL